ncbi:serine hydrolase domain-containing protein [Quadrisphaera setariae]|uniref:Beta-lactamase family protein n=1 Tax=Quadrisphaera setariae TaxID=2593304 RepID=A0A5C8ZLJ5_9ACTN|nr:serine hydrolase domain-containing protein [Quadrisphaera setariae]TXR58051.1 beta-lactamase family protein [Quadrisphaera setariae]
MRSSPRLRTPAPSVLAALVALVVGAVAAALVGPRPLDLGDARTGDPALAERVTAALGTTAGHRGLAVAWVEDGRVTTAGLGTAARGGAPVTGGTPFETGSVAKVLTGMLLADAAGRGEVRLDQPVGELVPGTALADGRATLAELATHRSGLPRLDPAPAAVLRATTASLTAGDPYDGSAAEVLDAAGRAGAPGGAEPAYSNLGVAALGDALAARAGTSYADLLADRLTGPLGMTSTTVATTAQEVPAGAAQPVSANGREHAFWTAEGYAPAGVGTFSTAADLGALAAAALEGRAPGQTALDPVAPAGGDAPAGQQDGLGWVVDPADPATGRPAITWHNGGTGGTRTYVGLDRAGGRAVVVLATGADGVEALGRALLTDGSGTDGAPGRDR